MPETTAQVASYGDIQTVADIKTSFQLSRVFALLGLIISILALGLVSALFLHTDSRLENLETTLPVSIKSIDEKLEALGKRLDAAAVKTAKTDSGEAKRLIFGSELSRTLYIMRYIAGDEKLSDEARQRAARAHAELDALLKELKTSD